MESSVSYFAVLGSARTGGFGVGNNMDLVDINIIYLTLGKSDMSRNSGGGIRIGWLVLMSITLPWEEQKGV